MCHSLQLWITQKESVEQFVYLLEALQSPESNKQYSTPVWKRAMRAQSAIQGDECIAYP